MVGSLRLVRVLIGSHCLMPSCDHQPRIKSTFASGCGRRFLLMKSSRQNFFCTLIPNQPSVLSDVTNEFDAPSSSVVPSPFPFDYPRLVPAESPGCIVASRVGSRLYKAQQAGRSNAGHANHFPARPYGGCERNAERATLIFLGILR